MLKHICDNQTQIEQKRIWTKQYIEEDQYMDPDEKMEMEYDGMSILIQCFDAHDSSSTGTIPSGFRNNTITEIPKNVFSNIGTLAKKASKEFRRGLDPSDNLPKEVELEFNFTITTTGKILILSGETEFGVKLRLTWKDQ